MKNNSITISDSGKIIVPSEIKMSIVEIADLFGIFYQTAKRNIRAIQKTSAVDGDYLMSCTVMGQKVYPDYYGLDMIIAVAFRIQSEKANIFRQCVCRRATQSSTHTVLNLLTQNTALN